MAVAVELDERRLVKRYEIPYGVHLNITTQKRVI